MPTETDGDPSFPADCIDPIIRRWGHAQCHILTLALHSRTGWPILTLHYPKIRIRSNYLSEFGGLLHSGVIHPSGDFVDIRGRHNADSMAIVASYYLEEPDDAGWRYDAAPSAEELLEALSHQDLIPTALYDADVVLDTYGP